MPRPKSKTELLLLSKENFNKLLKFIDVISKDKKAIEFPKGMLNRNIRDVLGHLHEWHLMFLDWYTQGMAGDSPEMPAKGYSWKDLPALNRKIQKKYENESIENVKASLYDSFNNIYETIGKHSDDELFQKKRYHWTGSTSLGAYLVSATSSHYAWALKVIRKAIKARNKQSN
ncbi:MAG: ClbS/DfsB family four-helix bundle protein [Bacteroidia bacterium]|nr:ClbS/DfsB family four-helix bundle protein [Bacteroidia bacterium]